ncbi:WRKY transcription factor [Heracleum sosnowskyi]|uniref:WRKY transcription factor n=1 Tax=Heracleum sosnowskyi TaxID=360622 RepID=A0AAD8MBW5_9APIA|nr:WRKY transcription factor [Heracleum sosnowskyi]
MNGIYLLYIPFPHFYPPPPPSSQDYWNHMVAACVHFGCLLANFYCLLLLDFGLSVYDILLHLIGGAVDDGPHNLSVAPCKFDAGCKRKWKVTDGSSDHPGAFLFLGGNSANELEEGSVDTGLSINLFSSSERRDEKRKKLSASLKALVLGRSEPCLELSLSTCPSESAITTVNQGSIHFQDSATQLVDEGTTSSRWNRGPRLPPLQSTGSITIFSLVPSSGITGPVIPNLSSNVTDAVKNSVACESGVAPQQQCRKSRVKQCRFSGCTTGSRGGSGFCIRHGGGRRCQDPGCDKGAEGKTMFCKRHGGGRRCYYLECTKSAEGRTNYCIGHGGGRRCSHDGCPHAARDKSGFCIKHGGGKRCIMENCDKSAEGIKGLCISHGGGHRCQYINCTKGAQGSTKFCKAHGGGKRCTFLGCRKGAEGNTLLCKGHGGGKRCTFEGGCSKSVHSGCLFCVNHGGGKRCVMADCIKSARGKTKFCVRHGGGKRCKYEGGCDKSAQGSTDFCKRHGGGKRCSWAQSGLGDQAVATCDKLAKGKLGLCASHTSQFDNLRTHGGSDTGPAAPDLQACLSKKTTGMYAWEIKHGKEPIQLQTPFLDSYLVEDCRPSQFSLPEGRVHGGSLMAMMRRESGSVGPSKDDNEVGCSLEPGSSHSLPHEWV